MKKDRSKKIKKAKKGGAICVPCMAKVLFIPKKNKGKRGGGKRKRTFKKEQKKDKEVNKIVQIKFPNNRNIRWAWLIRIRRDGRYVIRFPKKNILINKLENKNDKDFYEEKLAPLKTEIIKKKGGGKRKRTFKKEQKKENKDYYVCIRKSKKIKDKKTRKKSLIKCNDKRSKKLKAFEKKYPKEWKEFKENYGKMRESGYL